MLSVDSFPHRFDTRPCGRAQRSLITPRAVLVDMPPLSREIGSPPGTVQAQAVHLGVGGFCVLSFSSCSLMGAISSHPHEGKEMLKRRLLRCLPPLHQERLLLRSASSSGSGGAGAREENSEPRSSESKRSLVQLQAESRPPATMATRGGCWEGAVFRPDKTRPRPYPAKAPPRTLGTGSLALDWMQPD